jgi:diguanylate cyclase (GGDEF)-like protein
MDRSPDPGSVLAKVSQQLSILQKRDWELWLIVVGTGILVLAGFVAVAFPSAVMHHGVVHVEFEVSRELFLALLALLVLFNTYVINRRVDLRRTRESLISSVIQSELLRLQSFTDPLTEVYNRRSLDDMVSKYVSRARRLGKPLCFMIIDMDNFKEANTRFGHLTGDFLLAEIASLLKSSVRGSDAVVRYGGDEFAVILADAPLSGAEIVVARIIKLVEEWNHSGQLPGYDMGLSMGLAEWSEGKSLDDILNEADKKMYVVKGEHKKGLPQNPPPTKAE